MFKRKPSKGERVENAAVDATATTARVTAELAGAALIGTVKGLGRAVWRGVRPRKTSQARS